MDEKMLMKISAQNPSKAYLELIKERAESTQKVISKSASDLLQSIRNSFEDKIENYKEDYRNWEEVLVEDLDAVVVDVLHDDEVFSSVRDYFKSIM